MPWLCPRGHLVVPAEAQEIVYDTEKKKEKFVAIDWWWAHVKEEEAHVMWNTETEEPVDWDVILPWEVDETEVKEVSEWHQNISHIRK